MNKQRWYNGPKSETMDNLYDYLHEHYPVADNEEWPILSLHIARFMSMLDFTVERAVPYCNLYQNECIGSFCSVDNNKYKINCGHAKKFKN